MPVILALSLFAPPLCFLSAHQHISVKNESGQQEKRGLGPFTLTDVLTEQEEEG